MLDIKNKHLIYHNVVLLVAYLLANEYVYYKHLRDQRHRMGLRHLSE